MSNTTFLPTTVLLDKTDYALQARYEQRWARISDRFERMTRQLQPPYRDATLPRVLKPEELLDTLLR